MGESATSALANPAVVGRLQSVVKRLGAGSISDGSWFHGLLVAHLAAHAERVGRVGVERWERAYPGMAVEDRARREVRKVALKAAAAGAIAATLATTGELATLLTEGLAAPVGVPTALLSMVIEATYKALLQIDLVCDLGVIYDARFGPAEAGEAAALFAVALMPRAAPRGMAAELALLENGALAARVGRRILHGSFMRNALPLLGVPLSAGFSHAGTMKLGATAQGHLRYRRALATPVTELASGADGDLGLLGFLVEGVWLLATADGHQGLLAPAAVLHLLGPARRPAELSDPAAGDEDGWLAKLASVDPERRTALLDALYLAAAADGAPTPARSRFLRRAADALGRDIDFPRLERMGRHLAHGDGAPI